MAVSHVFDAEVIKNEDEHDGVPFVAPESRRGSALVLAVSHKLFDEEVVCQHAGLGQAIDTFTYLEVDPVMMGESC